jgi:regulator of protease activity HflC (stomatin/prohibitin superfamily)
MNYIGQIIEFLQRFFIWWVTIMPWEEAVHVRIGKHTKVIRAGIHLRLPFIDRVYVQTTRLRVLQVPPQTVTTSDGKTVTLVVNLGYSICDIQKLYQTLYHADQTLANIVMAAIAETVASHSLADLTPAIIEQDAAKHLASDDYGLKFEHTKITGFAVVKTYRLIQDGHWLPDGLRTDQQKG